MEATSSSGNARLGRTARRVFPRNSSGFLPLRRWRERRDRLNDVFEPSEIAQSLSGLLCNDDAEIVVVALDRCRFEGGDQLRLNPIGASRGFAVDPHGALQRARDF